jgi:N-acetylneuraminic acid mutarotase
MIDSNVGTNSDYIEVYNTVDNTWTLLEETMPEETAIATMCVVKMDIYLFGGKNSRRADNGTVHKLDTIRRAWTFVESFRFVMDSNPSGYYLDHRMIGSAHVVGNVIYLIGPGGNTVIFDPEDETTKPIES